MEGVTALLWLHPPLDLVCLLHEQGMHRRTWGGWSWATFNCERIKQFGCLALPMGFSIALDEWVYQVMSVQAERATTPYLRVVRL